LIKRNFENIIQSSKKATQNSKVLQQKHSVVTTSVGIVMSSRMGQEFLSSLSLLKVFLIATIFYQLNVGGYKNMCNAAPIGDSNKEVKYNPKPTRDHSIPTEGNDAESNKEADKTRKTKSTRYNMSKLFLYNLIASDFENDKEEMLETNLMEKIKQNPSILEEKVEDLVNNPSKFKQMLVKTIPQLIIDGLEGTFNNKETNDDEEENEKDLPRKKRSLEKRTLFGTAPASVNSDGDNVINFFGLELESASGRVWKKAFEKSLDEQNMYNTAASSLVKGVLRWVAWSTFAFLVHGPEHLFSY